MDVRGPLAGSYGSAVALVLFALTPYLILTSALGPLDPAIQGDLGASRADLDLVSGMSNAAYCFGTVLSVQLAMRLPPRRILLVYAVVLVIGSVLAAWAPSTGAFAAGHVIQGLATSLLLIAAAPALILGWPARKLRYSAIVMNMGIFGAVALGPVIGGAFATHWHALLWIVAGVSALSLAFGLLTFRDQEPLDPEGPVDPFALVLAATGCALAFFGASRVVNHPFLDALVIGPIVLGLALIAILIVHQHRVEDPLMPLRQAAQTAATSGIVMAMTAGAVSVGLVELTRAGLEGAHVSTAEAATLFWPELGGALATAAIFGSIFFTRWVPLYAFSGLMVLAAACAVLLGAADGSEASVAVGAGLLGLGVGAAVAPALFVAGFSMRSAQLPRVFAMIELLRGVAAFLAAPLILHLATSTGSSPVDGLRGGFWLCMAITVGGAAIVAAIWAAGGEGLQHPRTQSWLDGDDTAIDSPPIAAALRRRSA